MTTYTKNPYDIFDTNKIYEFAIKSPHGTFYDYNKVVFDPENNNYKTYSYYMSEGKMKPCQTIRNNEHYIIDFLHISSSGKILFKGPRFTEGPRKGMWDKWILTKRMWDI